MTHPRNLIIVEPQREGDGDRELRVDDATRSTSRTRSPKSRSATARRCGTTRCSARAPRAFHVGTIEAEQARDSHYVSFSFATGAALSRTNVYTTLDGEGCGATLNGLYMLDGEQHCDHQTQIIHAQPNCFSRELYKGVLDGRSHGVFNGKVYVHPIAQKTDGKQTNKTLLLSDTRARRHEAAARDLRRRREVHARRDGRADRPDGALLSEEPRHRQRSWRGACSRTRSPPTCSRRSRWTPCAKGSSAPR